MKWIAAAFLGWATGMIVFLVVWAALVNSRLVKFDIDRASPKWPAMTAMGVAFIVIALSWAGFFRDVLPIGSGRGPDGWP
jgi:hypothetical protein